MKRIYWFDAVCRVPLPFAMSLLIMGCVSTADFVQLTREVAYIRDQQTELTLQIETLKDLATDLVEQQDKEHRETLASQLNELNDKFETMAAVQSALDSALANMRSAGSDATQWSADNGTGIGGDFIAATSPCVLSDMPEMEPDIQDIVTSADNGTLGQEELSPRRAFEVAYQDYQSGDYDGAIQQFEGFQKRFPEASTSLAADAQYLVGTSHFRKRECVKAITAYEKLVSAFPHHKNNALGLLKLSYLYDAMGDKVQARSALFRLIDRHPRSKEAQLARQRLPSVSQ